MLWRRFYRVNRYERQAQAFGVALLGGENARSVPNYVGRNGHHETGFVATACFSGGQLFISNSAKTLNHRNRVVEKMQSMMRTR